MNTGNDTNTNIKSKKNIGTKTIIIIIAAAIVIVGGTGFIFYKSIFRFFGFNDGAPKENNVTVIKCHMFMTLTDSDIEGIKKVVTDAVGDKVLEIKKGDIPLAKAQFITDENGGAVNVGDIVYITFSILSDEELSKAVTALVGAYKLDEKVPGMDISDIMEINNIYRSEYDKKQ